MKYSTAAPTTPPITCATMYGKRRVRGKRPPAHRPTETAGLKWPPEIGPSAYAPDNTVRPKARDTPSRPIPTSGNAAASTALPQPPRTSQNVPIASATYFFAFIQVSPAVLGDGRLNWSCPRPRSRPSPVIAQALTAG